MSMCDERASTLITFIEKAENWNSFWKGKKTSLSYVSRRYFWELKKLYFRIDLDQCTRTFFSKIFFNLLSISEKNMASVWSTFILLKYASACNFLGKNSDNFCQFLLIILFGMSTFRTKSVHRVVYTIKILCV